MLTLAPEKLVGLSNELSDAEVKYIATDVSSLPVFGQIYGGKGDFNKEAVANADPQIVIDIGEAKKTIVEDLDGIQESIGIPCIHIEATYNTYDQAYEQLGELLAVAIELAIALATLLVEDEHLVALDERADHFGHHFGTLHGGSTHLHLAVGVDEQHFLKFNSLTGLSTLDVVHIELLLLLSLELLTVNLYDCVHCLFCFFNGFHREAVSS